MPAPRPWTWIIVVHLALHFAVGCKSASGDGDGLGGAGGEAGRPQEPCSSDEECDDGAYCNGRERCSEGFCADGPVPRCDDGIDCTIDTCSHTENSCLFRAPDIDGDGHGDASCVGPLGEPLGDDCDDDDANRFPSNPEVCTSADPEHDEDCDPTTYGRLDADFDGVTSDACCNEDEDGEKHCGQDCDDEDSRRFPDHPEICDDIDNDCDGEVDKNTREVPWYPDADGDQYGEAGSEGTLSCAPVEGAALRDTDCDDTRASIHPAIVETCTGRDDDCDGDIDEGGVCLCGAEGSTQACSCAEGETGTQTCSGGTWARCNCSECVNGQTECLGGLLPRTCVSGRWIVGAACTGLYPICQAGSCVCADGTMNCQTLVDVIPPLVSGSFPNPGATATPTTATLAVVFTEAMASSSLNETSVILQDGRGVVVPGQLAVGDTTLTYTPDEPLLPGMDYRLTIFEDAKDLNDNHLQEAFELSFITQSRVSWEPLDPSLSETRGISLSVAPSGHREMVVMHSITTTMSTEDFVKRYRYENDSWVGLDELSGFRESQIFIDDSGNGFLLDPNAGYVLVFNVTPSGWTQYTPDWGISTPLRGAINGAGRSMACWGTGSNLLLLYRDRGNGWSARGSNDPSGWLGCETHVAENGSAVTAALRDSLLELHVWEPGGLAPAFGLSLEKPYGNPRVAITAAGVIVGTLTEFVPLPQSGTTERIATYEIGTNQSWTEAPTLLPTAPAAREETGAQIGVDAAGFVHVSFVADGRDLLALRRPMSTSFTAESQISLPGAGNISSSQLHVAPDGQAALVWTQGRGGVTDLWGARFVSGSGWKPAERLESMPDAVTLFDADMDASGTVTIAYLAGEQIQIGEFGPN